MGRKHCGKRRNCLLQGISPFLTVFSEVFYYRHIKNQGLFGKGFTLYHVTKFWTRQTEKIGRWKIESYLKHEICYSKGRKQYGKGRKCWLPAFFFFLFPHCFQVFYLRVIKTLQDVVVVMGYKVLTLSCNGMDTNSGLVLYNLCNVCVKSYVVLK